MAKPWSKKKMFWADGMYVHGSGLFESPDSQCAAEYMDLSSEKVLLIIILNCMRKKVEEELCDVQAGYCSNRGTNDMFFRKDQKH